MSLLPRARDERGVVVPSRLMLIAIVVVAIGAAMYVATAPDQRRTAASPSPTSSSSASPKATPTSPAPSSSWLSASPTPSVKAPTPKASASASSKPSSSASSTPAAPTQAVRRAATFVEVFNNTGRKGLAGRTARRAEGAGWKVVGSDNWYGTIPTSTVYFPARYARAAKMLARDLGISRVEPAVAPMRNDRLTVILTSDFRNS